MRIQHYFPLPYPPGKPRKSEAVASVEPVRPIPRQKHFQSSFFEEYAPNERILKDTPQDLRVRQALKAYQSDHHGGEERATLWYGVDIYV